MTYRALKTAALAALLGATLLGQEGTIVSSDPNIIHITGDPSNVFSSKLAFVGGECPRHSSDPCHLGAVCADAAQGWLYLCVERDTWARIPYDRRW